MTASSQQKAVEITATLYKCREQSISLLGEDKFTQQVHKYKPLFEDVMKQKSCSLLEALIELLKRSKGHSEEGMLMHVLNAVACELSEPSVIQRA